MAPVSGAAANARTPGGSIRGLPSRPIVPVVPLPYLKRQTKNVPQPAGSPQSKPRTELPDDSNIGGREEKESVNQDQDSGRRNSHTAAEDGDNSDRLPTSQTANASERVSGRVPSETLAGRRDAAAQSLSASDPSTIGNKEGQESSAPPSSLANSTSTAGMAAPETQGASPTPTRRLAIPFRPSSNGVQYHSSVAIPGPAPVPPPHYTSTNSHRRHNPQHSKGGGLVFGGIHGSNIFARTPHTTGGPGHREKPSYAPDGIALPAIDDYGRPLLASPGADGFPPTVGNHHGPPTPHSFQGSQSSTPAEDNGYSQFPAPNSLNGYPAHPLGLHQHLAGMDPRMNMTGLFPVAGGSSSAMEVSRIQAQTLSFLRAGIEHGEFSDCTLELHFMNDTAPVDAETRRSGSQSPLRLRGHRFILSQSPTLKYALQTQGTSEGEVLRLEVRDEYARPEAFYFTIRTLYGWDFGDDYLPTYLNFKSVRDEFDLALGYLAASNYLQLPLIHTKALRYICYRLLHWETIEQACKFALPSAIFGPRHNHPAGSEGFSVDELLDAIMSFVISRFPPNFVLDTTVGDYGFSRLPLSGPVTPSAQRSTTPQETVVHGKTSSVSHSRSASSASQTMPRNPRLFSTNPRLSGIQFGDLSPQATTNGTESNGKQNVPSATSSPSRSPTPWDTILSRVLLNLPFALLKQILEHPGLGKPSGDMSMPTRQGLISGIIAEREARRLWNLEKSDDTQLQRLQRRLEEATEPLTVHRMEDFLVNSMGFKEEVFPGDVPYLVQTWVRHGSPA
ncbi:hypothetical protein VTK73DRAFT_3546 [Phialemonium thermophilum]|uniref:BTB domain-containing protein n=1 Tax=Phialemonium thermophilum TaxID=223376 RepID=A0ABR3XZT8_9PEZI